MATFRFVNGAALAKMRQTSNPLVMKARNEPLRLETIAAILEMSLRCVKDNIFRWEDVSEVSLVNSANGINYYTRFLYNSTTYTEKTYAIEDMKLKNHLSARGDGIQGICSYAVKKELPTSWTELSSSSVSDYIGGISTSELPAAGDSILRRAYVQRYIDFIGKYTQIAIPLNTAMDLGYPNTDKCITAPTAALMIGNEQGTARAGYYNPSKGCFAFYDCHYSENGGDYDWSYQVVPNPSAEIIELGVNSDVVNAKYSLFAVVAATYQGTRRYFCKVIASGDVSSDTTILCGVFSSVVSEIAAAVGCPLSCASGSGDNTMTISVSKLYFVATPKSHTS